jgi:hypothetical protein
MIELNITEWDPCDGCLDRGIPSSLDGYVGCLRCLQAEDFDPSELVSIASGEVG